MATASSGDGRRVVIAATLAVVPDTGDLRRDLRAYGGELRDALADPRAQQVLTTLVVEAASDPELGAALRRRILAPWRSELAARLTADRDHLAVPVDAALDMLVGPIHHRAVVVGEPVDDALVTSLVPARRPRPGARRVGSSTGRVDTRGTRWWTSKAARPAAGWSRWWS